MRFIPSHVLFFGICFGFLLIPVAENAADHIQNRIHDQTDANKHPQNSCCAEGICNDYNAAENGDRRTDRHPKPFAPLHTDNIHSPLQLRDACNQNHHTVHKREHRKGCDKPVGIKGAEGAAPFLNELPNGMNCINA